MNYSLWVLGIFFVLFLYTWLICQCGYSFKFVHYLQQWNYLCLNINISYLYMSLNVFKSMASMNYFDSNRKNLNWFLKGKEVWEMHLITKSSFFFLYSQISQIEIKLLTFPNLMALIYKQLTQVQWCKYKNIIHQ